MKLQKEEWDSIVKDLYGGHIFTGINVDPAAGSGVIGVLSMLWNIYGQLFEATPTALRGVVAMQERDEYRYEGAGGDN